MQKIGSKSQKLDEILRFGKLANTRFWLDLTHEKSCNSLNFEVEGSSFGFSLIFVCSKIYTLQLKLSDWFFNDLILIPASPGGLGLKILLIFIVQRAATPKCQNSTDVFRHSLATLDIAWHRRRFLANQRTRNNLRYPHTYTENQYTGSPSLMNIDCTNTLSWPKKLTKTV